MVTERQEIQRGDLTFSVNGPEALMASGQWEGSELCSLKDLETAVGTEWEATFVLDFGSSCNRS